MKKLTFLLTAGAFAGLGYMVGKNIMKNKGEGSKLFTECQEEEKAGDKIRKASMYAVGTIRTTADKIKEGINEAKTDGDGMVKKGEETVSQVKETTGNFKKEIDDLKNLVTSINSSDIDESAEDDNAADFPDASAMFEETDTNEISDL